MTLRFYQHYWCSPGPPQLGAFTLDVAPDVMNSGSEALKVTWPCSDATEESYISGLEAVACVRWFGLKEFTECAA